MILHIHQVARLQAEVKAKEGEEEDRDGNKGEGLGQDKTGYCMTSLYPLYMFETIFDCTMVAHEMSSPKSRKTASELHLFSISSFLQTIVLVSFL